jgi:hypothetical protein
MKRSAGRRDIVPEAVSPALAAIPQRREFALPVPPSPKGGELDARQVAVEAALVVEADEASVEAGGWSSTASRLAFRPVTTRAGPRWLLLFKPPLPKKEVSSMREKLPIW